MTRIEKIVTGLLRPINPYATSILGALTFCWGLWIISPFWHVFTTAAIYEKALGFAPEWAWGTWSTVCGLTMILALFRGAFRTLSMSLAFCMWHWFTIAGMFWWGDWQNTAGLTYTFVGIYALYSYLNVKLNYVKPGFHTHF